MVSTAKLLEFDKCSLADFKTCLAPASGNCTFTDDWSMFSIASGSRTGISWKRLEPQRVRVLLPEPLAPATNVKLGRLNEKDGLMAGRTYAAAQRGFP